MSGEPEFELTEEEWERLYIVAGWYDARVEETGSLQPAPDPLRALLFAAETLIAYVEKELDGMDREKPN